MTLIEILAVISVIIILFTIIMGLTGSAALKADKAKVAKELAAITSVLEEDRITRGRYALKTSADFGDLWKNIDIRLQDPWGANYLDFYIVATNRLSYVIGSPGPDGKVGKAFTDDDKLNGMDDIGELGLHDDILHTSRKD
jgi:type II secretory pathway pseudopilin PulG